MGINIDIAIDNMRRLRANGISYSMYHDRTGEDGTGDCSGTLYSSLCKAGASSAETIVNTDSMHDWLIQNQFALIAYNTSWKVKKGDIVIFGKKGKSTGKVGHVVLFTNETYVIHCAWKDQYDNGIYEEPIDKIKVSCDKNWYVYRLIDEA